MMVCIVASLRVFHKALKEKKSVFPIERSLHHQQYSCHARHQGEWNLAQDPWSSHVFGDSSRHMPPVGRDLQRQVGALRFEQAFCGSWDTYCGSVYPGPVLWLFWQIGISGAAPGMTGFRQQVCLNSIPWHKYFAIGLFNQACFLLGIVLRNIQALHEVPLKLLVT